MSEGEILTKPRATMRDVAALAGVSLKTVSRVANGGTGVNPETATRVESAMIELNFQRDLLAGSLRRRDRRSNTIGLVLARVDNPFDGLVYRGAETVAEAHGTAVLAASTDEKFEREQRRCFGFIARRVDGLVVSPTGSDQSYLTPEMTAGTPVVMIDRPPVGIKTDLVMSDHRNAARQATEHLLAFGHRRIAFIGDVSHIASVQDRLSGYHEAMAAAGLTPDPDLVSVDNHSDNAACGTALRLLSRTDPPTAIFAAQNRATFGVLRALYGRELQHQVALVSFDDFQLADMLNPAITVIAQNPYEIGRAAAQAVFDRLANPGAPVKEIIIPTRLIRRGSGEIAPS